jgi:hypothetical protein
MMTPPLLGRLVADLYGDGTEPDRPSAPATAGARRRKLWELEEKLHCPVIGTCLPMEKLQRFARRYRFEASLKDEFALHVEAVQRSMVRNDVAVALHRHLERKYSLAIRHFDLARGDADVLALWKERLAAGDVAGPLWAALTHRAASAATCQQVYADIHMLSHQVGAGQAADSQRLTFLEQECARLQSDVDNERKERVIAETVFRERVRQLEAELVRLQGATSAMPRLRERLAAFESGAVMVDLGRRLMSLQTTNEQLLDDARRSRELEAALPVLPWP